MNDIESPIWAINTKPKNYPKITEMTSSIISALNLTYWLRLITPNQTQFTQSARENIHNRWRGLTWTQFKGVAYKPRRTGARIAPVHIRTQRVHTARPRGALIRVPTPDSEGITRVARRTLAMVAAREVGATGAWPAAAVETLVNVYTLGSRQK